MRELLTGDRCDDHAGKMISRSRNVTHVTKPRSSWNKSPAYACAYARACGNPIFRYALGKSRESSGKIKSQSYVPRFSRS